MVPTRRKVAMARRSWSASDGVKPAATIAIRIACSWNSGTPSVLPSTWRNSSGGPCAGEGEGKCDLLQPLSPAQIGMHHVALDRPRAHDRDLDDEIVEFARAQPRQHRHLGAALDLEHADRVRARQHAVDRRVLRRNDGEIEAAQFLPSPRARGEGREDRRSEPGEGDFPGARTASTPPHPTALAFAGPSTSPRSRGEVKPECPA